MKICPTENNNGFKLNPLHLEEARNYMNDLWSQTGRRGEKKKIFFSNPTWQQKRQRDSLCKGRLRALRGLGSFWSWSWVSITCRHCLCWATNDAGAQLTEGKSRQIRSAEEKSIAFLLWKETYRKENILRRCTYVSALLSTNLPALRLFVLKCRAGLKGYPCLVCFTSELGKMEPRAATQRDSENKMKVENYHQRASTGVAELIVELSPPCPSGILGLPVRQAADLLSVPETPHFHGNNMFITKLLLWLLLGSSWDTSLTSPGLVLLLLQLISSFISPWSWQVEGQHKDLSIKYFITRQCKILTGMVNSKWPSCDGKWTNLWCAALLVFMMEGESQGDGSPACMQMPIKTKTPMQKEGLSQRVCVLEKFLGK